MNKLIALVSFAFLVLQMPANAGELDIPNSFTTGTPAVAADVNANFTAVETAVDGNAVDIVALLASISTMEARLATLEADVTSLQTDNANLVADNNTLQNFITDVVPYLAGGSDAQGQPTVFFSGANVHVNNGNNSTASIDGTGNLIIGYDESDTALSDFCTAVSSEGNAYIDQTECENNNGVWGRDSQKIGSHNLVIGYANNYTRYGGFIAGIRNTVTASFSSVSGGRYNYAQGFSSSISGGYNNDATAPYSSISGGTVNKASGSFSSVSGGRSREALDDSDWVAGTLFEDN